MLNRDNLHAYQEHTVAHILDNPAAGVFLDMGLGKTVSTLTAVDTLLKRKEAAKVLVIAPKRVAQDTWTTEAAKWVHLRHLRISRVLGTAKQRKQALATAADVYVINRENVVWLVSQYGKAFPFDVVVIDELSSFKSPTSARFKSLRMVRPLVKRVVGLTGTPAPNGLVDLWAQLYLLDQGERLGKYLTQYRDRYFKAGAGRGMVVYRYELQKGDSILGEDIMQATIYDKISDICISMKAEDWLELPPRMEITVDVQLSPENKAKYDTFEKKQVLEMLTGEDINAVSAAALTNKLQQFANGAIYDAERKVHVMHDEKLEALEELMEAANGSPVLVFYVYQHDRDRILQRFKQYQPRLLDDEKDIADWNAGKVQMLLAHPASAGHGLNIQYGGHRIVWFGVPWNLEFWLQANARLDRQGQTQSVIIHKLITKGTIDEDIVLALDSKADTQEALLRAVKARIEKYSK